MTFTKTALVALLLGASLTPALAESGETPRAPIVASVPSTDRNAIVEGRQTTPVATTTPDAAEAYFNSRVRDQNR